MEQPEEQISPLMDLHPSGRVGFVRRWRMLFQNIRTYRFFIRQLVRINILTEFKRSFIGLSWLFIVPILAVLVWILLNGAGIVEPGDTAIPYPAYVLLSTSIWGFFADIYKSSSTLFSNNGRIMIMTHFPREVLIVEKVIVHLIRFSVPFAINLIVLLYFGVKLSWVALLFPITLIPLLLVGLGLGLIGALLKIVAVDLSNLMDEGIRLLMFITPIVYAPKIQLGWLSDIVHLNPMTYLVGFCRDVLTQGTFYEARNYLICSLVALVFFLFVMRIFKASESRILERLINI